MWNAHCGRDLWEVATVSGGLWTSPWELVAKLWDLWQSQAAQAPREMWAATHIHSQIGSSCDPWGPCLPLLALTQVFYLGSCRLQPAHPPLTFTKAGSFVLLVCDVTVFPQEWSCASLVFPGFSLDSLSCVPLALSGCLYCDQPQFSPWRPIPEPLAWVPSPTHCGWAWECEPLLGWEVLFDKNLCCEFSALPLKYLLLHLSMCSPLRCGKLPPALPLRGFPSVWNISFFVTPSPGCIPWEIHPHCQIPCLPFYLYLLPYLILRRLACPFGSLGSSASFQKVYYWSCSTCRWVFDGFAGVGYDFSILFLCNLEGLSSDFLNLSEIKAESQLEVRVWKCYSFDSLETGGILIWAFGQQVNVILAN